MQCINILKDNEIFCINYKITEGCSVCKPPVNTEKYYLAYIEINRNDVLLNKNISDIINDNFINCSNVCINCGYDENNKIISKTYYKIYVERKYPDILFLVLEFIDENEGNIINNLEVEERSFNNRIIYNREIIEFLKEKIIIFNDEYKLAGFINTPKSDHYTALLTHWAWKIF